MELDVIFTAREVESALVEGKNAVVIDVLRATSTMITALVNGCRAIIPVIKPEDGLELLQERLNAGEREAEYLLCGERGGLIIPGYDFGNSPLEYTPQKIKSKTLIFCTTNGTLAINKSLSAKRLMLGALINGRAVAAELRRYAEPAVIVCAGTEGSFTLEDTLAAGLIIAELQAAKQELELTDRAIAALALYRHYEEDLAQIVYSSKHAKRLASLGFSADLAYCARKNLFDQVPFLREGKISLF